jgi:hypothetical protein
MKSKDIRVSTLLVPFRPCMHICVVHVNEREGEQREGDEGKYEGIERKERVE